LERTAPFILNIQGDLVSLQATQASIKELIEEIGRRMDIEVVARLPSQERITIAFDKLPIAEAMKRFGRDVNYVVVEEAGKGSGKITKIIVFPKRDGVPPARPGGQLAEGSATPEPRQQQPAVPEESPRPQPFRFEFNPEASTEQRR
jgi:hypothetical protein